MNTWIPDALAALRGALEGTRPPLEFLPAESAAPPRWSGHPEAATQAVAERPACVVRTSGSTGTPKETLLSAENLRASAEATAEVLGGHGQWLLTLQPSYVAGLAVLSRSLFAGTAPIALLENTTDPEAFAEAAEQLTAERRYVSLVPTQLQRLLTRLPQAENHRLSDSSPSETADLRPRTALEDRLLAALRRFDAILLGGGAASPALLAHSQELGLNVIRTYGMSETSGGCVYDGVPLPGVTAEIDEADGAPSEGTILSGGTALSESTVLLSGPMVALGYLDAALTSERFSLSPDGHRRYRTDDLGTLTDGVLSITGRTDDVINTGGVKVSAEKIRQMLEADPEVREAFVAGVEDPEWGQRVAAAIVLKNAPEGDFVPLPAGRDTGALPSYPPPTWFRALNAAVREELGPAAVPKSVQYLRALPRLANGKPDRQELLRLLADPQHE